MDKSYDCWKNMIKRCNHNDGRSRNYAYLNCKIHPSWLNYINFKEWYNQNYVEGFELDKDILFKGNKWYSPTRCCFVPPEINKLLTNSRKTRGLEPIGVLLRKDTGKYRARVRKDGKYITIGQYETSEEAFNAYKQVKESIIKSVANKYKHKLTEKVYNSLYNYPIEITD